MAAEVAKYHTLFYGSPSGYQTNRAQIALYDGSGKTVAYVRFNDPGMFFEDDYESGGIIRMHLPSAMFENVLDVLRNEKPIYIYFAAGAHSSQPRWSPSAKRSCRPSCDRRPTRPAPHAPRATRSRRAFAPW